MKTNVNFQGFNFSISSKLEMLGVAFPFEPKGKTAHNKFRVYVSCDGQRASFSFYGSENDYKNNKKELNESDLKEAFYCFVSDALSAKDGFDYFCDEFGYDKYDYLSKKIYRACEKSLEKLERIIPEGCDPYELLNYLSE